MIDILFEFANTLAQIVPGAPGAGEGAPLTGNGAGGAGGGATGGGGNMTFFFLIIAMMIGLMLIMSMSGRKQRKERDKMLSGVKRNDRVQTVGGVIGTVIELTDSEMVLRVDEASNTRIRFARSAIQQVLREGKEPAKVDANVQPAT